MKKILISGLSLVIILKIFEYTPRSMAPFETSKNSFGASLITEEPLSSFTIREKTPLELSLLETVIEQDRDYAKASIMMKDAEKNTNHSDLLKLYEAMILSRTLDFKKAKELLETISDERTALLKAAVLIALDDRDSAGAYLHQLADHEADDHIKLTALSLLNIYRTYDHFKEADKSYLWTLFAQKLGDLKEYEIAHYLAEKATSDKKEYRDAWIIKGYLELVLKNPAAAELSLLTAYELDPGSVHTAYLLGLTYFDLKKPQLSTKYLLLSKDKSKEYRSIILGKLAENAITTEEFPLAAHYYQALLEENGFSRQYLEKLIWLQAEKLSQFENALENTKTLIEHSPDQKSYSLLSWVYTKAGNFEEAKKALDQSHHF